MKLDAQALKAHKSVFVMKIAQRVYMVKLDSSPKNKADMLFFDSSILAEQWSKAECGLAEFPVTKESGKSQSMRTPEGYMNAYPVYTSGRQDHISFGDLLKMKEAFHASGEVFRSPSHLHNFFSSYSDPMISGFIFAFGDFSSNILQFTKE